MLSRFKIFWIFCSIAGICYGSVTSIYDKHTDIAYNNIAEPIIVENTSTNTVEIVEKEVEKAYEICETDKEIITKLVYLVARGECYDGKKAVISIVLNRLESGYWGDTITDVVYAKGQFTPAKLINSTYIDKENNTWNECIKAVDEVITYGSTLPKYVLYFRSDYYFSWAKEYNNIGNHYFSYLQKDYNKFIDSSEI